MLVSTQWDKLEPAQVGAVCIGRIVEVTGEGHALVDFPLNQAGPIHARSVIYAPSRVEPQTREGIPVLLAFENGDPSLPIIIGIIQQELCNTSSQTQEAFSESRPKEAVLDGKRVVFDAKEEIVLRCGRSSITLRKDGKIVVKGAQIVSRASGVNKLKGAAVMIN
jgi:hypothetical protein